VTICNCGELELRKKEGLPQGTKDETVGAFDSKERRRKHRSDSLEDDSSRRHWKRSKNKKHRSLTPEDDRALENGDQKHVSETDEEYDARLEREENERRQAERRRELAQIKKQYEDAAQSTNGVRFKGRGRMKYIDPEVHQRRHQSR